MATSVDYIEYVCGGIEGVGEVRYRKMFGEYMVYVNDKPVLLVCDNVVYVKILDCLAEVMEGAEKGFPYKGAREHYVLDVDDRELAVKVVGILEPVTAVPKPRKRSEKKDFIG